LNFAHSSSRRLDGGDDGGDEANIVEGQGAVRGERGRRGFT
jgi:hypothetical protein